MMSVPSISALTAGISCRAWTMALVKKDMKPSFTPWRFSKTSLYCARRAMTLVMSTSLKVVSWAAVFCDSFRRRAMVWRRRVILTRSSRGWSARGGSGRGCSGRSRRGGADGGDGVGLGDVALGTRGGEGLGIEVILGHHALD